MEKILIISGRYLPGYKDGGPVRSIINLIDHLSDEYEFFVLTADRDHGDSEAYPGIRYGEWNPVRGAKVMYVKPGGFTADTIKNAASGKKAIYMCGCFNDYARVAMNLKRKNEIECPLIIASMGLFSPSAISIHKAKKLFYISVLKALGFFKKVSWAATSEKEASDICAVMGKKSKIDIVQDMPRKISDNSFEGIEKNKGSLKIAVLSRIDRTKNIAYAISLLEHLEGDIELNIYGSVYSEEYWEECRKELEKIHYRWKYHGEVNSEEVGKAFSDNHILLLPTLGENYGHVIIEALSSARPVIISDRTPWKDLDEHKAGFAIPLANEEQFVSALTYYLNMPEEEYKKQCAYAYAYAKRVVDNPIGKSQFRDMISKRKKN